MRHTSSTRSIHCASIYCLDTELEDAEACSGRGVGARIGLPLFHHLALEKRAPRSQRQRRATGLVWLPPWLFVGARGDSANKYSGVTRRRKRVSSFVTDAEPRSDSRTHCHSKIARKTCVLQFVLSAPPLPTLQRRWQPPKSVGATASISYATGGSSGLLVHDLTPCRSA